MLQIIHTNDFHGKMTLECAEALRFKRAEIGDRGLMLDAGDAGSSGNITFRSAGEPILEQMNDLGYDAMTVGNRDFHLSRTGFESKLSLAKFPILCANVHASSHSSFLKSTHGSDISDRAEDVPVYRYIIKDLPTCRIAVFGLTVPMITERMLSRKVSFYLFDSPIEFAKRLVPFLKARFAPDILVGLTHIGYARDQELAARVPGIDLIIGGHSHTVLTEGERIGNTLIVQAGSRGSHIGVVDFHRGSGEKPFVSEARLIEL